MQAAIVEGRDRVATALLETAIHGLSQDGADLAGWRDDAAGTEPLALTNAGQALIAIDAHPYVHLRRVHNTRKPASEEVDAMLARALDREKRRAERDGPCVRAGARCLLDRPACDIRVRPDRGEVVLPKIARGLTAGELAYATSIFGADLDYRKLVIHNEKAYFFQPSDTAITPDGEIYFPPESYKADFATNASDASWLIHEMTHAWQHQKGMAVRLRGLLNRQYRYGDLGASRQAFLDYGIEQQASIVADYFRLTHGLLPGEGKGSIADYERVIPFLPRRHH